MGPVAYDVRFAWLSVSAIIPLRSSSVTRRRAGMFWVKFLSREHLWNPCKECTVHHFLKTAVAHQCPHSSNEANEGMNPSQTSHVTLTVMRYSCWSLVNSVMDYPNSWAIRWDSIIAVVAARVCGRLLQMEHLLASLMKSLLQGGHDSVIRVLPADLLSLFLKLFLIFVHLCNDSGTLSLSSRYISTVCLDRILHLQVFAFSSSWLITKVPFTMLALVLSK